jgi:phenylacetate-CoA ligase
VADEVYYDPDIETMSRGDIEAMQEERILQLVPYAYDRAPLIRKTWEEAGVKPADINSLADYRERAPFIDKDALRAFRDKYGDPFGGLLCTDRADATTILSTSGTTGDATIYAHTWQDWHPFWAPLARNLWDIGVRPGDYTLGGPIKVRGQLYHSDQMCGAIPLMMDTWLGNWEEVIGIIRKYRPVFATLSGPVLVELDHLSSRYDIAEVLSSFKAVGFAGEPLGVYMRNRLAEWGVDVRVWTSAGDVSGAWECAQHDGCHAWEDTVLLECLDPDGNTPVADGETGESVSTSLNNPAAPMLRFRSEDLVRMTHEPCACGRNHLRFWPLGRKGDEVLIQGRSVLPVDVWTILETLPETAAGVFQLIRSAREMDELRLRVGYDPELTPDVEQSREHVVDAITRGIGIEPIVEFVPDAELMARVRGGKFARVVKA